MIHYCLFLLTLITPQDKQLPTLEQLEQGRLSLQILAFSPDDQTAVFKVGDKTVLAKPGIPLAKWFSLVRVNHDRVALTVTSNAQLGERYEVWFDVSQGLDRVSSQLVSTTAGKEPQFATPVVIKFPKKEN